MKKILFLFLIAVIFNCKTIESQIVQNQFFPGKKSTWKGFTRYDFDFKGRSCRIVCPDKPAKGKPWIWNARFPDWHIDIDSILLSEGFHVTYINTDEFNGSPEGVNVWDEYFRYLTENFGFDNRVALEGISRGGFPPRIVADFIKENTRAFRTALNPSNYHHYRGSLDNSLRRFKDGKSGRVAFLGGSITYNPGWRDSISTMLQKMFPRTAIEFINAGIPSLGSVPDAFRLQQDVLTKGKIDLLFVEAAVNDRTNAYPDKAQVRAMEGIVRHARTANPETDIIFMYFVDPDKMSDYDDGIVPQEIVNHERVAAHYNIPAVNLAREVTERIYNKEFTWESDFKNLHPSPFGQQVYYRSIARLLEEYYDQRKSPVVKTEDTLPASLDPFSYDAGELISASKKDANDGWVFETSWVPADKATTREGFVRSPILICTTPGKILNFRFKGTAVGVAVVSGPDAGIIEYSIDRGQWKKMDLFTIWSNSVHLPWFLTLEDELENRSHVLRIRLTDDNMRHPGVTSACRIRYFYLNR